MYLALSRIMVVIYNRNHEGKKYLNVMHAKNHPGRQGLTLKVSQT